MARERISDTSYVDANGKPAEGETWASGIAGGAGAHSLKSATRTRVDTTTGWTDCGHDDYRPGVVFDPFHNPAIEAACAELERTYITKDDMLRYIVGDTRDVTATIPDDSVDLVCTSPPFLALRSYLAADHPDKHREIGSEANPAAFLDVLLELTAEWSRVHVQRERPCPTGARPPAILRSMVLRRGDEVGAGTRRHRQT